MPRYDYECESCESIKEEVRSIAKRHDSPECCGSKTTLLIGGSNAAVHVFQPMWAENLDSTPIWIKSKSHYKEEAKKRGKIVVDLL